MREAKRLPSIRNVDAPAHPQTAKRETAPRVISFESFDSRAVGKRPPDGEAILLLSRCSMWLQHPVRPLLTMAIIAGVFQRERGCVPRSGRQRKHDYILS